MATEYIEINSAYRNREQYPLASDFVVPIAQSGEKTALTALDPVSNATPQIVFNIFTTVTGILAPFTGVSATSSGRIVILGAPIGTAFTTTDYYVGSVVEFTNGLAVELHRIQSWRFLTSHNGTDFFEVTLYTSVSSAQQPSLSTFTITDATDLNDPSNLVFYLPQSVSADNYYVNNLVFNQTRNEWLQITYYDGITHLAQVALSSTNYTSGTWLTTDTYVVRQEVPIQYGQNIAGVSLNTAVIVPLANNPPAETYVGSFIRILGTNQIVRITSFNSTTNMVTVYPFFQVIPNGPYELLQFSYDNQGFLSFNNSFGAIREAVCYDMTLMNIVLPNFTLNVSQGSRSIFYPYVYVEFRSEKNSDRQGSNSIISNNPHAQRMLFRALLNDNVDTYVSPFVRLDGNGMVQRIKLDPQSSYHFSVHLPDGSLFESVLPEYYSPSAPNPLCQISALFSFKRVSP